MIDDEVPVASLLRRAIERTGIAVETANSGQAALDLLGERSYDAVICDLRMPDIGGQQIYEHVSASSPDQARRIIFLTGDASSDDAAGFLARTGSRYIVKPFELRQLLTSVNEVIANGAG